VPGVRLADPVSELRPLSGNSLESVEVLLPSSAGDCAVLCTGDGGDGIWPLARIPETEQNSRVHIAAIQRIRNWRANEMHTREGGLAIMFSETVMATDWRIILRF
jgi:hypothetical protein